RDLPDPACPYHPGPSGGEDGQAVKGPLGSKLLEDADRRVCYQDDAEQRVLGCPHGQDHHEQSPEQSVERREQVRPNDLPDGPAGSLRYLVHLAPKDPVANRCFIEPGEGVSHPPTVAVPRSPNSLDSLGREDLGTESPCPPVPEQPISRISCGGQGEGLRVITYFQAIVMGL